MEVLQNDIANRVLAFLSGWTYSIKLLPVKEKELLIVGNYYKLGVNTSIFF